MPGWTGAPALTVLSSAVGYSLDIEGIYRYVFGACLDAASNGT